eukprot:4897899-Pleurochrysis_carterae.AAC.3
MPAAGGTRCRCAMSGVCGRGESSMHARTSRIYPAIDENTSRLDSSQLEQCTQARRVKMRVGAATHRCRVAASRRGR